MLTQKKINEAIEHTGLKLVGFTGAGYFYFLDLNGDQAGDSVYVNSLNHMSLEEWVEVASDRQSKHYKTHYTELLRLERWVGWRSWDSRKIPLDPSTGSYAKTNAPATWTDYQTAENFWRNFCLDPFTGEPDDRIYETGGVGFVFIESDDMFGIDLDGCRDPETGEIDLWAWNIILSVDSYTEISPSGEGVHILARGYGGHDGRGVRINRSETQRVEVYPHGRYFATTFEHLDGYEHLKYVDESVIEEIIERERLQVEQAI